MQLARRGLGIGGVADGAHHHERVAPAAATSATFEASMPPIANQGMPVPAAACMADQVEPGGGTALLGGRLPDRPGADLVGPGIAGRAESGVELLRRMRGEPDEGARPREGARLRDRRVVLADVNAVGAAGGDEVGAVVQEEQGAVLVRGPAKRLGERDELVRAARRLLAQLDHIDASSEGRIQKGRGIAVARPAVADEVEMGGLEARHE